MLLSKLIASTSAKSPSIISFSQGSNTTAGTALSITKPTGVQVGDLLVAFLLASGNGSNYWNTAAGWTEQLDETGLCIQTIVATGSEPATLSFSTNTTLAGRRGIVVCIRNGAYASTGTLGTAITGVNNITAPSVSVATMSLVLAVYYMVSSGGSAVDASTPSGFGLVDRISATSTAIQLFSESNVPPSDSGNATSNWAVGVQKYARLAVVQPT